MVRRIGNKRLFKLSNHRLSKNSFYQSLELLEQAVIDQNVLLYGANSGVGLSRALGGIASDLSHTVTITGSTVVVNFVNKAFLVYGPNDATLNDGPRTVVYDPASPAQTQTSVDVSAFVGAEAYIWWKPNSADINVRSEAHWIVPSGETFAATETVNTEYVNFFVTGPSAHPTVNFANGWRVLGHIKTWVGLTPVVNMVHYIDSLFVLQRELRAPVFSTSNYTNPIFSGSGLVHLIKRIVDQLWMFQDSTANIDSTGLVVTDPTIATSWYKRPKYGAEQIASNLDKLNVAARTGVLAFMAVTFNDVTDTWSLVNTPDSVYAVDGFLASAPSVLTLPGLGVYNTCIIDLTVNGGYVITGVSAALNKVFFTPIPFSGFPPNNMPVFYAGAVGPIPIVNNVLATRTFLVGGRSLDLTVNPPITVHAYAVWPDTVNFVVYGYKKP